MTALLTVEGLNANYGSAHVLTDVSFELGEQAVAIIGRNGMGKTTLCAAIMGMRPPQVRGSVRFEGKELVGKSSNRIARLGIGYVPQGRRLFPSLTVDEHLRMVSGRNGGDRWTPSASTSSSRASPSGSGTAARSSPAASSRCSRSAAR